MLLEGVAEQEGWLFSRWSLTYPTGWESIRKAVQAAYAYFERPELLTDDEPQEIANAKEIPNLPEAGSLTLRGSCTMIGARIMLRFYNQTDTVDVSLPMDKGEFARADYERFNRSLCQLMDSVEIAMYR